MLFVPELDSICFEAHAIAGLGKPKMPAHITVLYPFERARELRPKTHKQLREIAKAHLPADLTLERTGHFAGVLWLDPASAAVSQIIRTIQANWPEYPPFGDSNFTVVPHVTLVQSADEPLLRRVEEQLLPRLPLNASVRALSVVEWDGEHWSEYARYESS
jgi:2'-5' RNA ligase